MTHRGYIIETNGEEFRAYKKGWFLRHYIQDYIAGGYIVCNEKSLGNMKNSIDLALSKPKKFRPVGE